MGKRRRKVPTPLTEELRPQRVGKGSDPNRIVLVRRQVRTPLRPVGSDPVDTGPRPDGNTIHLRGKKGGIKRGVRDIAQDARRRGEHLAPPWKLEDRVPSCLPHGARLVTSEELLAHQPRAHRWPSERGDSLQEVPFSSLSDDLLYNFGPPTLLQQGTLGFEGGAPPFTTGSSLSWWTDGGFVENLTRADDPLGYIQSGLALDPELPVGVAREFITILDVRKAQDIARSLQTGAPRSGGDRKEGSATPRFWMGAAGPWPDGPVGEPSDGRQSGGATRQRNPTEQSLDTGSDWVQYYLDAPLPREFAPAIEVITLAGLLRRGEWRMTPPPSS